ncbi:MAG: hypothetical protein ACR2JF_00820 [Iamia sp.]
MSDSLLRATEAARQLRISTKALLALIQADEIDYVMRDGIAHVPVGAIDAYRAKPS